MNRAAVPKLRDFICRSEWDEAHSLLGKLVPKNDVRRFIYHLNRIEYLELIESSQYEHALVYLMNHLKPLEDIAESQSKHEFKELCYLLSCKSVSDR